MKDEEIIPFLHRLDKPTLLSRDTDFYNRRLCHARYCLVYLALNKREVAIFVRRFLRHKAFNTQAKRIGLSSKSLILDFQSGGYMQKKRSCLVDRNART